MRVSNFAFYSIVCLTDKAHQTNAVLSFAFLALWSVTPMTEMKHPRLRYSSIFKPYSSTLAIDSILAGVRCIFIQNFFLQHDPLSQERQQKLMCQCSFANTGYSKNFALRILHHSFIISGSEGLDMYSVPHPVSNLSQALWFPETEGEEGLERSMG